jgi:hypothetical protein
MTDQTIACRNFDLFNNADHNAALNVLARLGDVEISRYTPYREVRRILLARSPAQLSVKRLELGAQARQPSADKSVNTF